MKLFELVFDENNENSGLFAVSLVNDPAIGYSAIQFSDEKPPILTRNLVDELKKLGKVPLKYSKNYKILAVEPITEEAETQSFTFNSEDNKHFQIRYRYVGPQDSKNRNFCKEMLSWNREWTIDDIALLDDLNPDFAPKGKTSYSILKYGGGVHCRHKFERVIYFDANQYSYDEALKKMPKNLVKQIKKLPKEVDEVANKSNNFWKLNFKSEEKERILTSPILIPNQKIYRQNINGEGAGYVFATAETIKRLAMNFFKNSYHKNSTIEHDEPIEGIYIFESWIIENPENDKANELGFKDLPKGTWCVSMKLSDKLWTEYIETQQVKGLSVDALLGMKEVDKNINQAIKFKNENQRMKTKNDFLNKIIKKARIKFNADLTIIDEEKGYGFEGNEIIGSTLIDAEGQVVADYIFTHNDVEYVTDAQGIIDLVAVEEEVEMNDENDMNDEIEIVAEAVVETVEELSEKLAELETVIAEQEAELTELRKQSPTKIGFSKNSKPASKKESFLELTRRLK